MTRYITRQKKQPRKKRTAQKRKPRHIRQGILSEIVINLKTPVRTPGGRILKSVSDRISQSPGTKADHDVTRLIVSTVPTGKQSLVEKRLEIIQEDPGLWARFKGLVHRNQGVAMGIAAVIIGAASVTAVKSLVPSGTAAKVLDNITDLITRRMYSGVTEYVHSGVSRIFKPRQATPIHPRSRSPPKTDTQKALDQVHQMHHNRIAEIHEDYAICNKKSEIDHNQLTYVGCLRLKRAQLRYAKEVAEQLFDKIVAGNLIAPVKLVDFRLLQ